MAGEALLCVGSLKGQAEGAAPARKLFPWPWRKGKWGDLDAASTLKPSTRMAAFGCAKQHTWPSPEARAIRLIAKGVDVARGEELGSVIQHT